MEQFYLIILKVNDCIKLEYKNGGNMLAKLIILGISVFIITASIFAQTTEEIIDSTKIEAFENSFNRFRISQELEANPFYFDVHNKYMLISPQQYWTNINFNKLPLPITPELAQRMMADQIHSDLSRALSIKNTIRKNQSLGVLTEILTYASFAATGALLYQHLKMYSKEYKEDFVDRFKKQ